MAEYEGVQRSALKLKGVSESGIKKKKKKKSKDKVKKLLEEASKGDSGASSSDEQPRQFVDRRTKAEIAFARAQEKKNTQQILEKASKTHKERILNFNEKLDDLTEHFDIPKVSWTK